MTALSQVEYLQKKLASIESIIADKEQNQQNTSNELRELYFQKGKLYSEMELMKRVPGYDN